MDDYDIKNYKLAGATSSIKAALFDITSELNTKILSLEDGPEKEELTERLKSIIELTGSFYDEIVLTDKSMNGVVTEPSMDEEETPVEEPTLEEEPTIEEPSLEEEEDELPFQQSLEEERAASVENSNKELNALVNADIEENEEEDEEDNTVQISDKAIDDMMNVEDEDDALEIDLGDSMGETSTDEEEKPAVEEKEEEEPIKLDMGEEDSEEEKEEPVEEKTEEPVIEEKVEETEEEPIKLDMTEDTPEETTEESSEGVKEEATEDAPEEKEEEPVIEEKVEEPVEEKKEEPVAEEKLVEEESTPEEETPKLSETEQAIADQKQNVTTKKISYIINKDNIDVAKAILVTSLQFEKLLLSRDDQKTLCKLRKYMVMPGEKEEEEVSLEELLQKAEELYKQGDTQGAEELYNKISELNKN